jgi:hypothetical protein
VQGFFFKKISFNTKGGKKREVVAKCESKEGLKRRKEKGNSILFEIFVLKEMKSRSPRRTVVQ